MARTPEDISGSPSKLGEEINKVLIENILKTHLAPFIEVVNQILDNLIKDGYQVRPPIDLSEIGYDDLLFLLPLDSSHFFSQPLLSFETYGDSISNYPPYGFLIKINRGIRFFIGTSSEEQRQQLFFHHEHQAQDGGPKHALIFQISETDISELQSYLDQKLRSEVEFWIRLGLIKRKPDSPDGKVPEDLSSDG